ncbi:MAG: DUF4175 family protein [Bacteroidia bacterium]
MKETQIIDKRLSEFRRKFYIDKLIRGGLILAVLTGGMLFIALLSEGLFGFSSKVRVGMIYTLGAVFGGVFLTMIAYPLFQLLGIGQRISDFQIADMVKKAFPDISDKLTNLLQLRKEIGTGNTLLAAAVNQKAGEISPVRLSNAINLNLNLRYARYLALLLLLFGVTYWVSPSIFKLASNRLLHYDREFLPPPPFALEVSGVPTKVVAGESQDIAVKLKEVNELPAELSIYIKKSSEDNFIDYNLKKNTATEFQYTLADMKEDFTFYVGNPEIKSQAYSVKVLKRPFIKSFNVTITNPAYTGLGSQKLEPNVGDFRVLRGSSVTWELEPQGDVSSAYFAGKGKENFSGKNEVGKMFFRKSILSDLDYYLALKSSANLDNLDTVRYKVTVLEDRHPSIYVSAPAEYVVDADPIMPLGVEIGDDYGFTKMTLFYRIAKTGGSSETSAAFKEYPLTISNKTLIQPLNYMVDVNNLGLKEGDELEYYIKVWDNDGIAGAKSSTSGTFAVRYPTLANKYEEVKQEQTDIKDELQEMKKQAEQIEDAYRKMQEKMLDQKKMSFDDRKEAQKVLDQHKNMMNKMEDMKEKLQQYTDKMQQNQMISEETLKKYEELNNFIKEIKNPELEKMLNELQQKMENINPEEMKEKMEQLKMRDEDMKKAIERTMELMKQLEIEQKIDEVKNKLDKLKEKQDLLNEKLENAKTPNEMDKLSEMQKELDKQMENIEKDLKELADKKEKTSTPDGDKMKDLQKDAKEVEKDMQDASQDMEKSGDEQEKGEQSKSQDSKQNAGKKQKSASKKMKKMSEKLSSMQMQSQQQQDEQNLEHLRELLENLLKLSFDQEDLRNEVSKLKYGDPALKDKSQGQKKLQDDMKLVKDSLNSLANKVVQIKQYVIEESNKITDAMRNTQPHFRNKQISQVTAQQQLAMTSINNLANMLSEVMKQVQAQMKANAQGKPGEGMCKKPGNKPGNGMSMKQLGQAQQNLNGMMQQMMNGGNMSSEQLSQMAAQQEALRKQLKEMHEKSKAEGGKMLGDADKIMQDMIESEHDLINKQLTSQTMMRQQQILSRLLQADKSMRERDYEERRESNTAKELDKKAPEQLTLEEYKTKIRQELLKTSKMEYNGDFILLIEQYFKKLEQTNKSQNSSSK